MKVQHTSTTGEGLRETQNRTDQNTALHGARRCLFQRCAVHWLCCLPWTFSTKLIFSPAALCLCLSWRQKCRSILPGKMAENGVIPQTDKKQKPRKTKKQSVFLRKWYLTELWWWWLDSRYQLKGLSMAIRHFFYADDIDIINFNVRTV